MAYKRLGHEDYLERVCGICFVNKKRKHICLITSSTLQDICDMIYDGYDLQSDILPRVICKVCKLRLNRQKQVNKFIL